MKQYMQIKLMVSRLRVRANSADDYVCQLKCNLLTFIQQVYLDATSFKLVTGMNFLILP